MPFRGSRSVLRFVPALLVVIILFVVSLLALRGCGGRHEEPQTVQRVSLVGPKVLSKPWTRKELAQLRLLLDTHFAPVLRSRHNGFVVLASDGSVLYDRNAAVPCAPASTLKVLTAATALRILGPEYRFTTRIAALDPIQDGVLDGDLYLIGGGDPVLSSHTLDEGVAGLHNMNLHTIMGHLVIDTTAFGGPEQNPHWAPDDLNLDYAAGTSALSLDGDIEVFHVTPRTPGQAARVQLEPQNTEAVLRGSIMTVGTGNGGTVHIDHIAGHNEYHLGGSINAGADQRFPIPVGNVGEQVGGVLDAMLSRLNIEVQTPARIDAAPLGAQVLWQAQSPPLREIVHHMLVVSDNHIAEQLLRTIAAASGHEGTEAEGIRVEASLLEKLGVAGRGFHLFDGSGLSPGDRIAPRSLAAVIADALGTPSSPLIGGLPRVGIEGTVRAHTLKASYGRVRAKSGHISGVDGLAGVIQTHRHGTLSFAFITNDADDGTVEDAEDTIFDGLMQF